MRDINPFSKDPYDAIGSFAVQGALLIGLLTYARALRLRVDATQLAKSRLIWRGNLLIVCAICITLSADTVAEIASPLPASYWGNVLQIELLAMWAFMVVCTVALVLVFRRIPLVPPPRILTPADAIDDLWALVCVPVIKMSARLPRYLVAWARRFNSDRLFAYWPWLNPRTHPWRFTCAVGLLAGVSLVIVQLQEGLPPSLATGLLVVGIYISGEFVATLLGFTLFGGYLGVRPTFARTFGHT